MPTYEYQCNACGVRFDRFHSINANPHYDCPECGGDVRKLISAPPIVFKGSGWYITDSRNSSSKAESKGESASETKSESKSESTAAASSASK